MINLFVCSVLSALCDILMLTGFLCRMLGVFVRFMRVVNASFVVRRRFVGDTVN